MTKILNFAERGPEARDWRARREALARQSGIKAANRMINAIREQYLNSHQAADIYGLTVEYLQQGGYQIAELLAEDARMRGALTYQPKKHECHSDCDSGGKSCDHAKNPFSLVDKAIEQRLKHDLKGQCPDCGHQVEVEAALAIAEYKSAIARHLVATNGAFKIIQWLRACYLMVGSPPL